MRCCGKPLNWFRTAGALRRALTSGDHHTRLEVAEGCCRKVTQSSEQINRSINAAGRNPLPIKNHHWYQFLVSATIYAS